MKKLFFLFLIPLCVSCSCIKSIKIKPEMNAVDIEKASIGVVKGDVDFVFKDCCPSKEEKQIALSIKRKSEKLFDQLLAGEIKVSTLLFMHVLEVPEKVLLKSFRALPLLH